MLAAPTAVAGTATREDGCGLAEFVSARPSARDGGRWEKKILEMADGLISRAASCCQPPARARSAVVRGADTRLARETCRHYCCSPPVHEGDQTAALARRPAPTAARNATLTIVAGPVHSSKFHPGPLPPSPPCLLLDVKREDPARTSLRRMPCVPPSMLLLLHDGSFRAVPSRALGETAREQGRSSSDRHAAVPVDRACF